MRIAKEGPFTIDKLKKNYPSYVTLLAKEIEKLPLLPDFSNDKSLFILSDFSGEHKEADYNTYSILICSADKRSVFEEKSMELRKKHKLDDPWKEYGFKDLRYGPIKRSLSEFLNLTNKYIHGLLLTISIDKNIKSCFGSDRKESHKKIQDILSKNNLGKWKGHDAEKVLRVCHAISVLMAVLGYSGQKILWLCDNDSINEEGKNRDFTHTQQIFCHCLSMYSDNLYENYGFAKPFEKDSGTTDLLSITDLAAGTIQEILQNKLKNKEIALTKEREALVRWMGRESQFLCKLNYLYSKKEDNMWNINKIDIEEKI